MSPFNGGEAVRCRGMPAPPGSDESRSTRAAHDSNTAPATSARIVPMVMRYPITKPATASPRPSSPDFLICDSEMWPNTMANGAKRKPHTREAIASALVRRGE